LAEYYGKNISIRVLFNEAGDRIPETYDFFGVENVNGEYKWIRKAVFDFGTGIVH
jgi:hypothetical protein